MKQQSTGDIVAALMAMRHLEACTEETEDGSDDPWEIPVRVTVEDDELASASVLH